MADGENPPVEIGSSPPGPCSPSSPPCLPVPEKESERGYFAGKMLYGASLPERVVRGMVGTASGVLKESAELVVPEAMKGMKLYDLAVRKMLRMMVEDVGGIQTGTGAPPPGSAGASMAGAAADTDDARVMRMAVSNVVDVAGMSALHLSPMWVLAIVSDAALGARTYFQALVVELKKEGIIDGSAAVESIDDLLGVVQRSTGTVADKLEAPPITIEELKRSVEQVRAEAKKVDLLKLYPAGELDRLWKEIQETATKEGLSVFQVSSAMAMMTLGRLSQAGRGAYGSVKVGFNLLDDNVLDYYKTSLGRIHEKGYYQALAETYEPYLKGLRGLFQPSTSTYTEDVLTGKIFRRCWKGIKSVFRRGG